MEKRRVRASGRDLVCCSEDAFGAWVEPLFWQDMKERCEVVSALTMTSAVVVQRGDDDARAARSMALPSSSSLCCRRMASWNVTPAQQRQRASGSKRRQGSRVFPVWAWREFQTTVPASRQIER